MKCDQANCYNDAVSKGKCKVHLKMICCVKGCLKMRNLNYPFCGFHVQNTMFFCYFPKEKRCGNLCRRHLFKINREKKCVIHAKFIPHGIPCVFCNPQAYPKRVCKSKSCTNCKK